MKQLLRCLLPLALCSTAAFAQSDNSTFGGPSTAAPSGFVESWVPQPQGTPALFDSRALMITNPGAGFGGADTSALQGASSSFGATATGDFRLAEDFTVPAGGWTLTGVTVYAYQTQAASNTTSTLTTMTLRIWNGDPSLPASTVVFGDTTTNVMTSSTFSGIYRTTGAALTNGQRAIMGATAGNLSINLTPGTYWLDWSLTGSVASGPFAPFVTIPGQNASGNAQQLTVSTSTWALIVDTGSTFNQTLPMRLDGTGAVETSIFKDGFELPTP
ncbi:hypothetical protein DFR29_116176 [Tahibacter aquaticus]|uniref:Uncharacterized protein n=1 Tax=Tahibacter aquaticus TaxID=520092 RepID=A0A4R6YPI2_9GAMM|nr:hypothetical protein [Tahibacter aquaticus]TDR39472.1 hypothetical protein DFR29_116176 [Tahibacter aquaticus]